MKFRSHCRCDRCGLKWTTKKRRSKNPPAHCPRCFSVMTRVVRWWRIR